MENQRVEEIKKGVQETKAQQQSQQGSKSNPYRGIRGNVLNAFGSESPLPMRGVRKSVISAIIAMILVVVLMGFGFLGLINLQTVNQPMPQISAKDLVLQQPKVLSAQTQANLQIDIPADFSSKVTFTSPIDIQDTATFHNGITIPNGSLEITNGTVTAPNLVYSVTTGLGVISSGGQNPVISNTGVLSIGGQSGDVSLKTGTGISIDGVTITNSDAGSAQKIFKTIKVGSASFDAGSNTDTLTFQAGTGITLSSDTTDKTITITGSAVANSGWVLSGNTVYLSTLSNDVGIGTSTPAEALDVVGNIRVSGNIQLAGNTVSSLTGNGLTLSSNTLNLSLLSSTDGSSGITSSYSGLEFSGSGGNELSLLQGCTDGQILKWDATNKYWICSNDAGGSTAVVNIKEGNTTYSGIDTVEFDTNDFTATKSGSLAYITVDYPNSHITRSNQAETISQAWGFNAGINVNGTLSVTNQNGVQLYAGDTSGNYTGFKAPSSITSSVVYTLPQADGSNGALLSTNGSGGLSWITTNSLNYFQRSAGSIAPLNITDDLLLGNTATNSALVKLPGTNNQNAFFNLGTGNFGIGTTNPIGKLDVSGAFYTATGTLNVEKQDGVNEGGQINLLSSDLSSYNDSAIDNFQGTLRFQSGTVAGGSNTLRWNGAALTLDILGAGPALSGTITGFKTITASNNTLTLDAGTANRVTVGASDNFTVPSGNVGIGTTSTGTYALNVVGNTNLSTGNAYNINGISVLNSTTLGSNVVNSSLTTVGTISTGTWQGTAVGAAYGGTGLTGYTAGDLLYAGSTNPTALSKLTAGSGNNGKVLTVSGGLPTWADAGTAGINYWQRSAGALAPLNITDDLLIGSTATGSANFAFINNSGSVPVASVAGNIVFSGARSIVSRAFARVQIGDNQTGDILLSPGGNVQFYSPSNQIDSSGNLTIGGSLTVNGSGTHSIAGTLDPTNVAGFTLTGNITGSGTPNISSLGTIGSTYLSTGTNTVNVVGSSTVLQMAGTTVIDASRNLTNIGTTEFNNTTYTWPNPAGLGSDYVLSTDTNGNLTWKPLSGGGGLGGGTITAVGNETSGGAFTATGTTSTSLYFANSGFHGQLTIGTLTGNHTYTLPDATGTICLTSGNCAGTAGGSFWQENNGSLAPLNITDDLLLGGIATSSARIRLPGLNNQNAFFNLGTGNFGIGTTIPHGMFDVNGKFTVLSGGNVGVGTTSPAGLLDVNGKLTVLSGGNVGIGTNTPANQLTLNAPVTADSLATAIFTPTAASNKVLVIQGFTGQTANLQEWQQADGGVIASLTPSQFQVNDVNSIPSYNNAGGTGDRTASITVSTNLTFTQCSQFNKIINGVYYPGEVGCLISSSQTAVGKTITFDFGAGASKVITEAKMYQAGGQVNQAGTWQWEGSNDGSNWTTIGSTFTLGGVTPQTQNTLSSNTTGYRYYQLAGVSGGTGLAGAGIVEYEFKIANSGSAGNTYIAGGFLGLGTNNLTHKLNVAGTVTGKALAMFNETGTNDIFTASNSGTTKLVIDHSGNLSVAAGTVLDTLSNGTLGIGTTNAMSITLGRSGQTLTLGGYTNAGSGCGMLTTDTSGILTCSTAPTSGTNWWTQDTTNGVLYPNLSNLDVLFGGTATSSAHFAFVNNLTGTPTASISAGTSGALSLTATGTIATTAKQTLTLGDGNTGNVALYGFNTAGVITNNISGVLSSISTLPYNLGGTGQSSYTKGDLIYADNTNSLSKLNIGSTNGMVLTVQSGVPVWSNAGAAGVNLWQETLGSLSPYNITDDLAIGGTATSSAKFQIYGSGTNSGTATTSGNLVFRGITTKINQLNGGNITFQTSTGGDAGLSSKFVINNNGNIQLTNGARIEPLTNSTTAINFANASGTSFVTLDTTNQFVGIGTGTTSPSNQLTLNNPITDDSVATAIFTSTAATNKGLVIQGFTGQTANLQEWQTSDGGTIASLTPSQFIINDISSLPSYNNTDGKGNRSSNITVTSTLTNSSGTPSLLVDGNYSAPWWSPTNAQSVVGKTITFDFGAGTSKVITEAKWYHTTLGFSIGTWKWQGSNDGSTWTDIGGNFTLGGTNPQVQNTLSGNSTAYRYYQLIGVSGTTASGDTLYEIEFKIANPPTAGSTYIQGGFLGIGTSDLTHKLNVAGTVTGKALAMFNETGTNDIFTASNSGTTKFVIDHSGNLSVAAGTVLDTLSNGTLGIGTTNAMSITLGRSGQTLTLGGYTNAGSGCGMLTTDTSGVLTCSTAPITSKWQETLGSLAPTNITDALNIGATATSSAFIHFAGTSGDNSWFDNGRLGVGTKVPIGVLDVDGNSGTIPSLILANNAQDIAFPTTDNLQIGKWDNSTTTFTELLRLTNSGNLGIGTTNPTAALDVAGKFQVNSNGNIAKLNNVSYNWPSSQATAANYVLANDGSGNLTWSAVTGQWQRTLGSLAPYNITDALNLGATATSSALIHLPGTTNQDAWFNLGTGNLGIGTTTPSERLTVSGSIAVKKQSSASSESWTSTSTGSAPTARQSQSSVWTGSKMIVWGGYNVGTYYNTGGIYDPATDTWTNMSTTNAPSARYGQVSVWTGSKMIVWGGNASGTDTNTGGIYDPATDTWTNMSTTNAPTAREYATAVWAGSKMIVWSGWVNSGTYYNNGAIYDPTTNTWTTMTTTGAPTVREHSISVWTGSKMIVWGGYSSGNAVNTGGSYDPVANSWSSTTTTNAPTARYDHTAVWTGSKMIIWGGFDGVSSDLNTGGSYDPVANSWSSTTTTNAPTGREYATAVWTGSKMIVWGGYSGGNTNTGSIYDPGTFGGNLSVEGDAYINGELSTIGPVTAGGFYSLSGADIAENYVSSQQLEPGTVVEMSNDEDPNAVKSTNSQYSEKTLGIITTNPGISLYTDINTDSTHPYKAVIALAGRVPVKVSTINGSIHTGDLIASSSIPGVAMKATEQGFIIGKALEDYTDPSEVGTIMVFVNTSWYTPPTFTITSTGDVTVTKDASTSAFLAFDPQGNVINNKQAFSDVAIANLKAGKVDVQDIFGVNLVSQTGTFNNLSASILNSNSMTISDNLSAGRIDTSEVNLGDFHVNQENNNLIFSTATNSAAIVFSPTGDASFSGTLTAKTINAKSGDIDTLHVKNLVVDNIRDLTASSSAIFNLGNGIKVTTAEMDFGKINTDLTVYGSTTLNDLAAQTISVGNELSIGASSLNTVAQPLEIQSLKQQPISIMADAIHINTDGTVKFTQNVEFAKDVKVGGVLSATTIKGIDDNLSVSGSATFDKVNFTDAGIKVISDTEVEASGAAGIVTLKSGETQIKIYTSKVTDNSLIFITPKTDTTTPLYIKKQIAGQYFIVGIKDIQPTDTEFNFLIIN